MQEHEPSKPFIDKDTLLFGYIDDRATSSSVPSRFNKHFKAQSINAAMVGMNVRQEDLPFTLDKLSSSQLKGVLLSSQFAEYINHKPYADTFRIDAHTLQGTSVFAHAFAAHIAQTPYDTVLFLEAGALTKAILTQLHTSSSYKILLYATQADEALLLIQALSDTHTALRFEIIQEHSINEIDVTHALGVNTLPTLNQQTQALLDQAQFVLGYDTVMQTAQELCQAFWFDTPTS